MQRRGHLRAFAYMLLWLATSSLCCRAVISCNFALALIGTLPRQRTVHLSLWKMSSGCQTYSGHEMIMIWLLVARAKTTSRRHSLFKSSRTYFVQFAICLLRQLGALGLLPGALCHRGCNPHAGTVGFGLPKQSKQCSNAWRSMWTMAIQMAFFVQYMNMHVHQHILQQFVAWGPFILWLLEGLPPWLNDKDR